MPKTILSSTETETPESEIVCETLSGQYDLLCVEYTGSPVKVQIREPNATEWRDAAFAGRVKMLTKKGQVISLPVAPCFAYRCVTDVAGARVDLITG